MVWEKPVSAAIERIDQCVASAGVVRKSARSRQQPDHRLMISRAARRTCLSKYVRSCALRTSGSIGRPFTPVICHKRPPPKFRALIYNATNLSARRRNRTPDRHNNHNWGHKRYAMPLITAPAISPPARPGPQPPPRHRASAGDGTADAATAMVVPSSALQIGLPLNLISTNARFSPGALCRRPTQSI